MSKDLASPTPPLDPKKAKGPVKRDEKTKGVG